MMLVIMMVIVTHVNQFFQAALDKVREDINTAREAYRQTFIVQVSLQFL